MNRILRITAAVLIVAAAVAFFAADNSKAFAALLVLGNLASLAAHFREER